jgi:hypothetical protein
MQLSSFVTTERALNYGVTVYQSALPTKDEDRTVVLEFEHGTMIAIFDGLSVVQRGGCSLLFSFSKATTPVS